LCGEVILVVNVQVMEPRGGGGGIASGRSEAVIRSIFEVLGCEEQRQQLYLAEVTVFTKESNTQL